MLKRMGVDRGRGSKRKKKGNPWDWLCNPQVLRMVFAGARLIVTLVRLIVDLFGNQ